MFTGRLASMSRTEACACVASQGGTVRLRVSVNTDVVVIGSDGWPLSSTGRLTKNLARAEQLQRSGHRIEVIPEAVFLRRLGRFDEDVRRLHTLEQLSRMLGISGLRLRRWVREGLIRPAEEDGSVVRFDYTEVTAARTLSQFLRHRRSVPTLVQSLERLRRWLPGDGRMADHLLKMRDSLVVRDAAGRIVDSGGQYLFGFDARESLAEDTAVVKADGYPSASMQPMDTTDAADDLFDRAFTLHQQGDLVPAIQLYQRWISRYGSDADVYFNLGNAHAERGNHALAIRALKRSVRCQPDHDRAWNNLGLSLAQIGRRDAAIAALRQALKLDPDYADACYNLADLLDEAGRESEASLLWLRYLAHQQSGQWSDYARERLSAAPLSCP
ncbi:MAG: tetratricopeptide repeat protein [Planctomycetaceae bacterium]